MKKKVYESPLLAVIGILVPQVFCASGELEDLNETEYSGGDGWTEII